MGGTPKTALPPQDRAASLNKNLPHLPKPPTLPLIMGIQPDLILLGKS
ncbi:MAG: hypothetical protein F6K65_16935 [Moorea sp. SIO3C2]|nr:hypothetical protein [Moorena sp. SIO3C2]